MPAEKESKGCLPPALGVVTDTAEWSGTGQMENPHAGQTALVGLTRLIMPASILIAASPEPARPKRGGNRAEAEDGVGESCEPCATDERRR